LSRAADTVLAQDAALEELRVKRLRYDPEVDDSEDSGYPLVEDEFASDTSNSSDMWERRDARGRLLPPGKKLEEMMRAERPREQCERDGWMEGGREEEREAVRVRQPSRPDGGWRCRVGLLFEILLSFVIHHA
jgi:hypothetical protein